MFIFEGRQTSFVVMTTRALYTFLFDVFFLFFGLSVSIPLNFIHLTPASVSQLTCIVRAPLADATSCEVT